MLNEIVERLKQGLLLESDYAALVEALSKGDVVASGAGSIAAGGNVIDSHLTTIVLQFGNDCKIALPETVLTKLIEMVRRVLLPIIQAPPQGSQDTGQAFRSNLEKFVEIGLAPACALNSAGPAMLDAPAFKVAPSPNTGANWKPDPAHLDEDKGYQFRGHFEVEATLDCDVRSISLHVMRNGHLAICAGPGKASYYNGSLPNLDGKFRFVTIDGDKHFVDANYNFVRLLRYKAGQKSIVSIGRWCRAIGISRNEPATDSLWYWIEEPTQLLRLEYSYNGLNYAEEHHFTFKDATTMLLHNTVITTA